MNHFCIQCGHPLNKRNIENRIRDVCENCGWISYDQLKATAGVFLVEGERLLLVKRAIDPWKGYWYLPAGFIESDESPIQAAEREGKEETCLEIKALSLIDVYFYNDDPRGNGLLILYSGKIMGGEIGTNDEADEIRFFSPSEIAVLNLAGGGHDVAIHSWLGNQTKTEKP
jgi:8-oxo-dGTP diphosphatase